MDDGKPTGPQAKWWSRPTARRADHPEPHSVPAPAGAPKPVEPTAPDQAPPAPAVPDAAPAAPDQVVPHPRPAGQPLHEPDEYGTPPYGGPGPWAPAPPVQRPTPAHGTVVPPEAGGPQYAATNGSGPAPADGHTSPHGRPTGGFAPPPPAATDAVRLRRHLSPGRSRLVRTVSLFSICPVARTPKPAGGGPLRILTDRGGGRAHGDDESD
ncbi:hypothetical protein SBADM41S_02368 [Streptomyces badius]